MYKSIKCKTEVIRVKWIVHMKMRCLLSAECVSQGGINVIKCSQILRQISLVKQNYRTKGKNKTFKNKNFKITCFCLAAILILVASSWGWSRTELWATAVLVWVSFISKRIPKTKISFNNLEFWYYSNALYSFISWSFIRKKIWRTSKFNLRM